MRLPVKESEAKIGKLRREGTRRTPRSRKDRNNWTRKRLDYAALEAAKIPVETILYKDRPATDKSPAYRREVRIALMPWSRGGYLDIRVYINGKSTGQGILLHLDHMAGMVSAVLAADRQARALGLLKEE
jgi:hypothetical protein